MPERSFPHRQSLLALLLLVLPLPAVAAPQMIAADSHLLWLKPDGTVWASGDEHDGARGDAGDPEIRKSFKAVPGLADIVQIAVRDNQSYALKSDGTVWVWGLFCYMEPYEKPKPVQGFADIQAIAGGADFVIGLKRDGSVWLAGSADHGLGSPSDAKGARAVPVAGLKDVVGVGATANTAFIVRKDGSVWGWGSAYAKLLGAEGKWSLVDSDDSGSSKPLRIQGVENVVALSGGENHILALTRDGKVYAWGDNESGALGVRIRRGLGAAAYQLPGQVDHLPKITAISAGDDFSLALDGEGKVWAWGNNTYGTLGVHGDRVESRIVPEPIQGIEKAVAIHAGDYHGFAVLADGRVLGWGSNEHDFIPLAPQKPSGFLPPTPIE